MYPGQDRHLSISFTSTRNENFKHSTVVYQSSKSITSTSKMCHT